MLISFHQLSSMKWPGTSAPNGLTTPDRPINAVKPADICPTHSQSRFMEEPVMPDKWMSVAEAAATLRVHTRTIERRIAGGKIQSRRADDGLLQVMISLSDEPDNAPDTALETVRELADNQVTLATGSASALVKFARDDAGRAREELTIVRQ